MRDVYDAVTSMSILPALRGSFAAWETDPERVIAAVRQAQGAGGECARKYDGHWVCLTIGKDGCVSSATSRTGRPLVAASEWVGRRISSGQYVGWTVYGEAMAGTQAAVADRPTKDRIMAPIMVFGALDRAGKPVVYDRLEHMGRTTRGFYPCERALRDQDWGDFVRAILAKGGEGVVIYSGDGRRYKAKPIVDVDMIVEKVYTEPDRYGRLRCKVRARLPGRDTRQILLLPSNMTPAELHRGDVIVVVGTCQTEDGLVRNGRIGRVRPIEDCACLED